MSKQLHIKNHYVPQLYLKNWAIDGKVNVYNNLVSHKNVPLFQKKNISAICYMNFLYANRIKQKDFDEFEQWINNKVEIPYKSTQNKILSNIKLSYDDYQNLSRYVIAQYLRVPKFYALRFKTIVNELEHSFLGITENALEKTNKRIKYKINLDSSSKHNLIEEIPINIERQNIDNKKCLQVEALIGRKAWLSSIQRIVEETLGKLPHYKWQIIKAIEGFEWYTSDNPVTLLNYWSKNQYNFDGAWKVKHTNIFMPISPQYLLFTEVGSRKKFINTVSTQMFLNKCIIENSFLQVYSNHQDSFIFQTRPRIVDANEYKRIYEMLSNWHIEQSKSEDEFLQKISRIL